MILGVVENSKSSKSLSFYRGFVVFFLKKEKQIREKSKHVHFRTFWGGIFNTRRNELELRWSEGFYNGISAKPHVRGHFQHTWSDCFGRFRASNGLAEKVDKKRRAIFGSFCMSFLGKPHGHLKARQSTTPLRGPCSTYLFSS